jgi:hypothetical protein
LKGHDLSRDNDVLKGHDLSRDNDVLKEHDFSRAASSNKMREGL